MNSREMRAFNFEVRAEQNEEHGHYLTGTPIVMSVPTDMGWYEETIAPGALKDTDLRDVRFLVGHNTGGIPLARSRNNNAHSTMQMSVSDTSMDIRVDLDIENNAEARALYSAASRGDISGMSFMFTVAEDSWADADTDYPKRTITAIRRVYEVSAVTFPAYEQTKLEARGAECAELDSARASLESARQVLAAKREAAEKAERRNALLAELRGETHE